MFMISTYMGVENSPKPPALSAISQIRFMFIFYIQCFILAKSELLYNQKYCF